MSGPVGPDLTLPLAFLTGLLGALHCLGMCSGVAGGYFVRCGSGIRAVLSYHGTRMTGTTVGRNARGLLAKLAGFAVVVLGLWTLYEGWVFFDIMRGLSNW